MNWDINRPIGDTTNVDDWLVRGGTTFDGIAYGPPSSAVAWGAAGCPLISRVYRLRYGQQLAPKPLRKVLEKPNLLVSELDTDVLRQFDLGTLSDGLLKSIRDLIYEFPILPRDVAIPPGIPVSWVTALPTDNRIRNRLRRFPWPHDWITEEPLWCSQLMSIRGIGKSSLNELLCVIESAELEIEQTEMEDDPTVAEMTGRILGRVQLGRTERWASSQSQVRREHDRRQVVDKVLPVEQDVHDNTTDSAFQEAVKETARQAIRVGLLQFDSRDDHPAVIDEECEAVCSVSALGHLLREFVTWALAETDAQTIGEAISQLLMKAEAPKAWQDIAELSLNQAGNRPEQPYSILESWSNQLPKREQHIFNTRIACLEGMPTLKDLGDRYGVSRERIRQLEKRVRRKLSIMLKRESTWPIHWRAETLRQNIGVAAPLTSVENLLSSLNRNADFRGIVLELAGPYKLLEGWLVLKSALSSEPTPRIRDMADEIGFIDPQLAAQALKSWGLDMSLHEEWLMRDGKIHRLNGRLVRWDGSIGDKMVIALADIGRPATAQALLDHIEEGRAKSSVANALSSDSRAIRVSRNEWALESWGFPEYSSISESIRQLLRRHEEPLAVEHVVTQLRKKLGMKENSVRAYCQAPMFILANGVVRLRREDEPYIYDVASLRNAKGVFALGPQRVSLLMEVDSELLRGSGRVLTHAAGSILEVALNQLLTFNSRDGDVVTVTFPETSINGPFIGSVRSLAMASKAKLGDQLTLVLDRSDMSVTAVVTDLAQHEPGWQLASRLTGIVDSKGLEGLAAALRCEKGEVRALLSKRGDNVIRDALPTRPVSYELDRALANFAAQLQHT